MTPTLQILQGDALAKLRTLPDNSVHMAVTSPPYWGLRDYGTAKWEGGDPACDHKQGRNGAGRADGVVDDRGQRNRDGVAALTRQTCAKCGARRIDEQLGQESSPEAYVARLVDVFHEVKRVLRDDGTCWLNLGDSYAAMRDSKVTPDTLRAGDTGTATKFSGNRNPECLKAAGLKHKDLVGIPWMVAFALRADGWYLRSDIIWQKPNPMPESVTDRPTKAHEYIFLLAKGQSRSTTISFFDLNPEFVHLDTDLLSQNSYVGCTYLCVKLASSIFQLAQEKSNLSLPPFYSEKWKQRFECRNSDLISSLPTEDRLTCNAAWFLNGNTSTKEFLCQIHSLWTDLSETDHLLICGGPTKMALSPAVFLDGDAAIAVNHSGKVSKIDILHGLVIDTVPTTCKYFYDSEAIKEDAVYKDTTRESKKRGEFSGKTNNLPGREAFRAFTATRNKRSVWTVTTAPYRDAHFATFPPALITPAILAGSSSVGCCPHCGAPWERQVEKVFKGAADLDYKDAGAGRGTRSHSGGGSWAKWKAEHPDIDLGFIPTCKCEPHTPIPCVVLDPFAGSGTTGQVAMENGRSACLIELNPSYLPLISKRCRPADHRRVSEAFSKTLIISASATLTTWEGRATSLSDSARLIVEIWAKKPS